MLDTPSPLTHLYRTSGAVHTSAQLHEWIQAHHDGLGRSIYRVLREKLFSNRPELRPSLLGQLAADEATALQTFLIHPDVSTALERGGQLCRLGLGEESLLAIGQAARAFFLNTAPPDLWAQANQTTETYYNNVIRGFMAAYTAQTLEEQERIRSALQRTLSRYMVQMAVAADIARAATSILNLDEVLQTAVELIRKQFSLFYIAVFLADEHHRWAYLQASAGEVGQVVLRRGYRIKIGGDSLVGQSIVKGVPQIALDVGEKASSFNRPLLTAIHSEMVLPLSSRGKVIGAIAVQTRQVGALAEQDMAVLRLTADQLANAIENARLFREREQQISQLSILNEMGRALSAALDFNALLKTVHQQVGRIYNATFFSIATYNQQHKTWMLVYDGCSDQLPAVERQLGDDLISFIARQGKPLLLATRREQLAFAKQHAITLPDAAILSWMGVPLIAADAVVGVMTIASAAWEHCYTRQDLVVFTTIAAQVAIAIANARLYEQLRHDAFHDGLTGLANRTLFLERLEHTIAQMQRHRDQRFAVLFLDLDRFKIINDSLGHTAGDQLLPIIARRLESCLRSSDTVARLGGDEFAILLSDAPDEESTHQVAERIQQTLATPVSIDGHDVFTTASIGMVMSDPRYHSAIDMIRDADISMYRAKTSGKACAVFFDPVMHIDALSQLQLESELRRSMERSELRVYYQPIVELESSHIVGFEALIRWQHPHRGLLYPAAFLSMAEETGMIVPMGWWVLREACRQLAAWQSVIPTARSLWVNVNLSEKQLAQHDVVQRIMDILEETGLPAHCLKLEITEHTLLAYGDITRGALRQIRNAGIHLCIDDFGTGYSSLSYLQRFPVNVLKIDRSFIGPLDQNGEGREIVQAIIALTRALGIQAIAEGMETAQQVDVLRRLGCEYGQGWVFAKALEAEEIERLVSADCSLS
jgi:diguanylate cyclase (GGDEF)-like protein